MYMTTKQIQSHLDKTERSRGQSQCITGLLLSKVEMCSYLSPSVLSFILPLPFLTLSMASKILTARSQCVRLFWISSPFIFMCPFLRFICPYNPLVPYILILKIASPFRSCMSCTLEILYPCPEH